MKLNLKHFSFLFVVMVGILRENLPVGEMGLPTIDYYFSLALWSLGVTTYIQSFSEVSF